MESSLFTFEKYSDSLLQSLCSKREGERKLGELISSEINASTRYVILGVMEDFGPQINGGQAGSNTAFDAFLSKFVNIQSNQFLEGSDLCVLGKVLPKNPFDFVKESENIIEQLDAFVGAIVDSILEQNCIPIVIGGGHNNAFPLIKSCARHAKEAISVVNCDPHADYRVTDVRHSGNSFSFAYKEGILERYAVLGLHQSYNNQTILDAMEKDAHFSSYFDDYMLDANLFEEDISYVRELFMGKRYGLELDMDAIQFMPSSAMTPSGISIEQARKYIGTFAHSTTVQYLHLPEASPATDAEKSWVGKALAYLVSDFIKQNKASF